MKTVLNKTHRPLKIHLSKGKLLHLGPGREGQISNADEEKESLKKLVSDGVIEIVGGGSQSGTASDGGRLGRPESQGHHANTAVKKRGDR